MSNYNNKLNIKKSPLFHRRQLNQLQEKLASISASGVEHDYDEVQFVPLPPPRPNILTPVNSGYGTVIGHKEFTDTQKPPPLPAKNKQPPLKG